MDYLHAFRRSAECYDSKTAIVTEEGRSVTYGELDARSSGVANALHERIPGERCATLATNGLATVESMLAGVKRGVGTVQLPFRGSPGELASMLDGAEANGLLFDDATLDTALAVLDSTDVEVAIHAGSKTVEDERVVDYEELLASASSTPNEPLPTGDEYGVFYTSGTTSQPKAVRFDREQMWLGATQVVMEMGIDETDTALVVTPWYHMVTTDAWILPHLLAGATLVLQSGFEPDAALRAIAEHDVTGLLAVPTQLTALIDAQQEAGYDLGTLSYIRTGGSVVTDTLVERAAEHLTEGVYNSYGLTEGGPNLAFAHPSVQDEHTGSVGKASFVWDLRVVEAAPPDEAPDVTAEVAPNERGEVIVQGPGMCEGYLDNPEAEEKLFADGWIRTGDVAQVDEDGYLYIVDRIDNMIISGGENVYPEEVQQILEEHEAVAECLVVGLADEYWGETIACVVVTDGDVDDEELDRFCTEHETLADFKRPRRYAFRTEPLPRTDTGTIRGAEVVTEHFED
jgi:acyl-CoA synthetase (AMP-forming)/AMP-acid ligase II